MKKQVVFLLVFTLICESWSIPKPMESVENYNVLMVHGAYGASKGFGNKDFVESRLKKNLPEAIDTLPDWSLWRTMYYLDTIPRLANSYVFPEANADSNFLGEANIGYYGSHGRLTYWLNKKIFEDDSSSKPRTSYTYHWRSFSNPANSSSNNAHELGDRKWNQGNLSFGGGGFGHRRTLMEEAQEVRASIYDSTERKYIYGQEALDSIRKNPDLYRQLASRYILVGHSMGGVVSREYVQSDYYNDDVDKIITLDSPHEGTGSLNMNIATEARDRVGENAIFRLNQSLIFSGVLAGAISLIASDAVSVNIAMMFMGISLLNGELTPAIVRGVAPETYYADDPLVGYVDPRKRGVGTINNLNEKSFFSEGQPMYRLLASRYGLTFSDPTPEDDAVGMTIYRTLVPDVISLPLENLFSQLTGSAEGGTCYVNAMTAMIAGMFGIPIKENGSSIVPEASSSAKNVDLLNNPEVDTRRAYFNAAPYASESVAIPLSLFSLTIDAVLALEIVAKAGVFGAAAAYAAKFGIVFASAYTLSLKMIPSAISGFSDIAESHTIPLGYDNLDTMKVAKNSFSPIGNGESSHTPYLMEDFLYERPFVNLALSDSRTIDSLARNSSASLNPNCYFESDSLQKISLCEVGLYGSRDSVVIDPVTMKETHIYNAAVAKTDSAGNVVRDSLGNVVHDSVYYGTFEQRKYSEFRKSPLKFKSESDWYKVGVKVDRWERVDGLKPNGDPAPKGVPIRHVERYSVPDIVVTGFIEKYSFVVDDLMPHRMRQIKMTFNSNDEVAWECDISKAEDDQHACAVYKRKLGNSWGNPDTTIGDKGYVAHPIKKNGRFDFNARTYFGNLADIQKDNQNTVMISMVNKIGLSNTQRFYYLFKATDNMLKPKWPEHDVVLNEINGFKAYVSALDYQGFRVHGASDAFFRDSLGNDVQTYSTQVMDTAIVIGNNNSEYVFVSKQNDSKPAEGKYRWVVSTNISNKELKSSSEPDSSKTDSYEVHFKVDRTAPAFTLTSDAMMNPDSSVFITRFKWDGSGLSDIRAMFV